MTTKPLQGLSPLELDLVLELLRREFRELSPEIHHTQRYEYRVELRQRRKMVEGLIDRLQSTTARTGPIRLVGVFDDRQKI